MSRRRFIKSASAAAALGLAGVGLRGVAGGLLGSATQETTNNPGSQPPSSAAADNIARRIEIGGTGGLSGREGSNSRPTSPADQDPSTLGSFSIFWITDTQFLSEENPALFRMLTNWIVDNWTTYNGTIVIHTGDIVQHGDNVNEWATANEAMSILLRNGIPYTWCAGNHDDLVADSPDSGWSGSEYAPAFNPSVVCWQVNASGYASWAGDYRDGMNTAIAFTANGLNLLVVNIEWIAESDVLNWVESLLNDPQYSGYSVILAPHAYINPSGSLDDPQWGSEMASFLAQFTPLLDNYSPRVFLTLNGHFSTDIGYNSPTPINGRNELMFDRQDSLDVPGEPTGRGADNADLTSLDSDYVGGATVTVLTFYPSINQVSASTYDVYAGGWREDSCEQYTFTMFPASTSSTQAVVAPVDTSQA